MLKLEKIDMKHHRNNQGFTKLLSWPP